MEKVSCNNCQSEKDTELYKDDEKRIVICDECSLVYLNPRWTADEYEAHYNKNYQIKRHNIDDFDKAVARLERKDSYERKKAQLPFFEEYINKDGEVLDIGSGWGTLLKVIEDAYNCDVTGIEISNIAAQVSDKHYRIRTYNETLQQYFAKGRGQAFDFIILNHVMEHFLDPIEMLRRIKSLLKKGGSLFLAVPNMDSPDESLNHYFRIEHTYYYTLRTLADALQKAGLKIIKFELGKREIKVIVAVEKDPRPEVLPEGLDKKFTAENIQSVIRLQRNKYKVLRFLKKCASHVMPKRMFNAVRKATITLLKKLHIIEI